MEKPSMRGMGDAPASARRRKKTRRLPEGTLIVTIVVLAIALTFSTGNFLTTHNLYNLVRQTSINGIVAIGMTFVIISGGIDLSVGAVVGCSGILAALLMKDVNQGVLVSCFAGVLVSALVGVVNGVLIYNGRVPPFIATLGSMTMLRGSIMLASDARNIAGLPRSFSDFAQDDFLGLPMLFIVWLIIIAVAWFITRLTVFGRKIYAVGSNVEATRLSGVDLKWVYYGTYTVCSLFCGIAGILYASRLRSGIPTGGQGYEMDAIAASVIGGASLSGAEGSILGTVLGAVIMAMLRNGGNLLGVDPFVLEIVIGALIVVAVLIDQNRKAKG
ncbi:MAG: ABC transporter permease [Planctomycetota bacterium]|nr:ABC transporter permease [Planctomycetota bacterium]